MQQYELLCVLPGTLTEDEVKPSLDAVQSIISEKGGKTLSLNDMGKSRLAYPMQHIRYGYFRLCRFEAEPASLPEIQHKLRLQKQLLRAFITKQNEKSLRVINFAVPAAAAIPEVDASPVFTAPREPAPPREAAPAPVVSAPEPAKEEVKVDLEDISKKLDEILERDITAGL